MPKIIETKFDTAMEEHVMRREGLLGRGTGMGNSLFAIDIDRLPFEATQTIELILAGGPFPYPPHDGGVFGNRFGDLPNGRYLEFTVPTPGATNRGARRIVARAVTGQLFFTSCHYERVAVKGVPAANRQAESVSATEALDPSLRNGFAVITGIPLDKREAIKQAINSLNAKLPGGTLDGVD